MSALLLVVSKKEKFPILCSVYLEGCRCRRPFVNVGLVNVPPSDIKENSKGSLCRYVDASESDLTYNRQECYNLFGLPG